jgi:hypothetical protein
MSTVDNSSGLVVIMKINNIEEGLPITLNRLPLFVIGHF